MPVSSGLNLNSGLSGVRPRPSGGVGLARPVASTQGIIAPQQAPQQPPQQQPVQQRTVAPPSLPKSAPAQPAPQAAPGGEMNAFSKIGLLLSNVAAGMEGRPLPSDQLEQNRLKREELKMRQTMQNMEIAGTIATIAAKTPGGQVSKVVEGLFATLPDQSQTSVIQPLVEALTAKPQIDEDTYPIVAPYLAQLYDVGGLDAVQKTLDSDDRMQALRDRAVAESRESADMKMQQVIGLVQKGAQSGVMPPDVAQSLSGTMTADKVKELNRALPPKMRLSAVETAAIEEFGFNGFGVTILSKKIADKVAEADALRPGELSEFEQKERLRRKINPPSGEDDPNGLGNSYQARLNRTWLRYQNILAAGGTLTDEQNREMGLVKRALEQQQIRIDPETGQQVIINPEPLTGVGAPTVATPQAPSPAAAVGAPPPGAPPALDEPAPDENSLFTNAENATGVFNTIRDVMARTVGQEWPGVANPQVLQAQQSMKTASNAAIRALSLNNRFPEGEMNRIREEFAFDPSAFDSPIRLRNRAISVDASLDRMVKAEQRIIDNPKIHVTRKNEARETIMAMKEYKAILGVPPRMSSQDAVDKLPPGTSFIWTDGETYEKE